MNKDTVTGRFTDLGRNLHRRLKDFFDTPLEPDATPFEISQAVLEYIERSAQPAGRGRRVFPYTGLTVQLAYADPDRAALDAAFDRFEGRVLERLRELRCEAPDSLDVAIEPLAAPPPHWASGQLFAVRYRREIRDAAPPVDPAPLPLRITVLKGASPESSYTFTDEVISIGRTPDPSDALGRLRRNRIAFLDLVDGITETVGRAHARLRYDAKLAGYVLFDEGSSNGTSIIRRGDTIPVFPRDPRGVRVESGDEVQVGRALLRVEIGS